MKKKKAFTLLEIMIVIFLIGLIGSIIGYNMKGSLEEGKAFKTKQAQARIRDLIEMEIARGCEFKAIEEEPEKFLKASGVVKNTKSLMKDGWGEKFKISYENEKVVVFSQKLARYKEKKLELRGIDEDDEEDE